MTNSTPGVLDQSELAETASGKGNRRKEKSNEKNCIWNGKDDGLLKCFGRSYMETLCLDIVKTLVSKTF